MTIRTHKKEKYTQISNRLINDRSLSWDARGLLIYLLSKPNGWIVRLGDLINQSPSAGRDKVKRILGELNDGGYLYRYKTQGEGGKLEWHSEIFESPEDCQEWLKSFDLSKVIPTKPIDGFSIDGSSIDGSSIDGQPVDVINTDLQKTDLKNTDLQKTELIKESAFFDFQNEHPRKEPALESIDAELIEPSDNPQQSQSPDPKIQIVEIKSSGAGSIETVFLSPLIRAYNANKPPLWAKVLKDNSSRQKALQKLIKEYGSETLAIQALQDALAFCRRDPWWSTKNLGIDAILRDGRVTELAEKYKSIQENPSIGIVVDRLQDPKELERLRKKERQKQMFEEVRSLMEGGAAS